MEFDQLGEFGLIERIQKQIGDFKNPSVLSIGDDTAVFPSPSQNKKILFTTDALVEGVHFKRDYTPMQSLGWKALAINISDIAAMGGIPKYAVVSLAIPKSWRIEDIDALYQGMIDCSKVYDCMIVGGDTTKSPNVGFISVAVVGEVDAEKIVYRSGTKPGDLLGLTRAVGNSRVALEILEKKEDPSHFQDAIHHFLEPAPELFISQKLSTDLSVSSMIDVSDGLASEVGHLCRMNQVGCEIWSQDIPVSPDAKKWCDQQEIHAVDFALESGEEYALLFTAHTKKYAKWMQGDDNPPLFVFGKITDPKFGIKIKKNDIFHPLTCKGWDHFKK